MTELSLNKTSNLEAYQEAFDPMIKKIVSTLRDDTYSLEEDGTPLSHNL